MTTSFPFDTANIINHVPAILLLATLCATLVAALQFIGNSHHRYPNHPRVGEGLLEPWLRWTPPVRWRLHEHEAEGYAKYSRKEQPFVVNMYGVDALILPPKYLPAIKNHDRWALSFAQALQDNLQMDATMGNVAVANNMEIELVTKFINLKLNKIMPLLAEEADFQFSDVLGSLPDFKTFNTFELAQKLVFNISNRLLVGEELCRDAVYMKACGGCMMSSFLYGVIWNFLPLGIFRKSWYWLAAFKFRRDLRFAASCLMPILEQRMRLRDSGGMSEKEKPVDVLQFAVDQPIASLGENDAYRHAVRIIQLTFASTGTVITLVYRLMYLILLHPEYLEPLREEIEQTLKNGGNLGDVKTLNELHRLDSFIRETMRVYPSACFFGQRTAREPTILGDLNLPAKARIAFPAASINLDPGNYMDASLFDGFRFTDGPYSKRSTGRIGAAAVDEKFLSWGYGNQACPGRFLAVRLVKMIFGRLLLEYDFAWTGDDSKERIMPKGMVIEGMCLPDINTRISIRTKKR